jgi:ATP-dependent RNA helicase DeaD
VTTFTELGLSEPLLEALRRLGYEDPTPIQEQAIPELLAGKDVIGQAQTGTGKTAAFGLPMLQFVDPEDPEVQALVLTPTRELCIQVTQAIRAYGERRDVSVVAVFGGAPIRSQVAQLKAGAQVVVGTVGRVMDLMNRHDLVLTSARYMVLDEADEMLDLGFLEDVETILSRAPSGRQTALFSATMPPEIKRLAESRMYDPVTIKVQAATLTIDTVEHFHVEVTDREKATVLADVIEREQPDQAIVFVRTKIGVDRLARSLGDKGVRVKALHGDMSQGTRDGVMLAFKNGRERVLVATDVAARGLDISGVTHVVNYDLPNSPEIYVHRIGRTGRVGRSGRAITLITAKQRPDLEAIERHSSITIGPWSTNGEAPKPARGSRTPRTRAAAENGAPPHEASRVSAGEGAAEAENAPAPPEPEVAPQPEAEIVAEVSEESADSAAAADVSPRRERSQVRRPRHTKPRRAIEGVPRTTLVFAAGRVQGLDPADLVGAVVEGSGLDGEDVTAVRVLERFSLAEVPADRAEEVVRKVAGSDVRGVALRLEVARR